jgi:tyrosyl-tRNA synthetase
LQKHFGQAPQCILTMPLLEGLDGVNKMSKSLGNYVGINEPPGEMFGKLMSVSDELMWRYFELLSFRSSEAIEELSRMVAADATRATPRCSWRRRSSSAFMAPRCRAGAGRLRRTFPARSDSRRHSRSELV